MKTIVKFSAFGLMVLALVLTSCSKEGPEGPAGPQGPQGEQGVQGPQGDPGTDGTDGMDEEDGEDGNANVMASPWIPVQFQTDAREFTSFFAGASFSTEEVNNSLFLAYGKFVNGATTEIYQLPFVSFNQRYIFSIVNEGTGTTWDIEFTAYTINGADEFFDVFEELRYFVVPANATVAKTTVDPKKLTYEEVIEYYGLDH